MKKNDLPPNIINAIKAIDKYISLDEFKYTIESLKKALQNLESTIYALDSYVNKKDFQWAASREQSLNHGIDAYIEATSKFVSFNSKVPYELVYEELEKQKQHVLDSKPIYDIIQHLIDLKNIPSTGLCIIPHRAFRYPVKDIYRVDFVDSATSPPQIASDWYEEKNIAGTELYFLENHTASATIHVWYERHPTPFPSDLTMNATINDSVTSIPISSSTNTIDWPATGYLKIDNEVMSYSAVDRTASPETLTVARAKMDTAAAAHNTSSLLSFVNLVEKEIFFDGVRDIAIAYLNRMRIVDAPSSDIGGNITVMREIMDSLRPWIREHRMRSKRPAKPMRNRARPMRYRKRGVRG